MLGCLRLTSLYTSRRGIERIDLETVSDTNKVAMISSINGEWRWKCGPDVDVADMWIYQWVQNKLLPNTANPYFVPTYCT